jgi:hypothetical protein
MTTRRNVTQEEYAARDLRIVVDTPAALITYAPTSADGYNITESGRLEIVLDVDITRTVHNPSMSGQTKTSTVRQTVAVYAPDAWLSVSVRDVE